MPLTSVNLNGQFTKSLYMDIKNIHSPADIKNLSLDELTDVAGQLRAALMKKLSAHAVM